MSIFLNLPTAGHIISQAEIDKNVQVGAMPSAVRAYASLVSYWGGKPEVQPNEGNRLKYWASPSGETNFLFVSGRLDLSAPDAFSDYSFQCYSPTVANFYRERLKAGDARLKVIPKLAGISVDPSMLLKMNFEFASPTELYSRRVTAEEAAYPIATLLQDPTGPLKGGYRWTFASNRGLCFDQTGQVQSFDYQEYDKAYPIKTTVSVGEPTGRTTPRLKAGITQEGFCFASFVALAGSGTPAEKTALILANLE